jgi:SPP1 family predicted phage head-tail adaptor
MSGAGKLDRRIVIQRATVARNSLNEPLETWSTYATLWANRKDATAGESYKAQEVDAELSARFLIRSSATTRGITPNDRVSYGGDTFNITQVREVQRNRWIEIDAVRRADQAATDTTDDSP